MVIKWMVVSWRLPVVACRSSNFTLFILPLCQVTQISEGKLFPSLFSCMSLTSHLPNNCKDLQKKKNHNPFRLKNDLLAFFPPSPSYLHARSITQSSLLPLGLLAWAERMFCVSIRSRCSRASCSRRYISLQLSNSSGFSFLKSRWQWLFHNWSVSSVKTWRPRAKEDWA